MNPCAHASVPVFYHAPSDTVNKWRHAKTGVPCACLAKCGHGASAAADARSCAAVLLHFLHSSFVSAISCAQKSRPHIVRTARLLRKGSNLQPFGQQPRKTACPYAKTPCFTEFLPSVIPIVAKTRLHDCEYYKRRIPYEKKGAAPRAPSVFLALSYLPPRHRTQRWPRTMYSAAHSGSAARLCRSSSVGSNPCW